MKRLAILVLCLMIFSACKDNPVTEKIKETRENVSNAKKAVKEMEDMQKDIKELQEVEPLTNEDLKAWLPEEINGMKRTGFKAGQMGMMNIASIEGTYNNEDKSKRIRVELIDGAGSFGATATASMRLLFSQEFEEEDEYKVKRTTVRNGTKAIEEYRKNNSRSMVQFMQDDRFYIKVTGTNMNLEETWDAVDALEADELVN